jgi:hypothetical protein
MAYSSGGCMCVEKISDRNGWISLERLGNSVFYGARYLLNT